MTNKGKFLNLLLVGGLIAGLTLSALAERPKKKDGQTSVSVMDSTEGQWGCRSINDSLFRGYTVNAVYAERSKQKLPDSFHMYKPQPITEANLTRPVQSDGVPTTIRINGKEQKLKSSDSK